MTTETKESIVAFCNDLTISVKNGEVNPVQLGCYLTEIGDKSYELATNAYIEIIKRWINQNFNSLNEFTGLDLEKIFTIADKSEGNESNFIRDLCKTITPEERKYPEIITYVIYHDPKAKVYPDGLRNAILKIEKEKPSALGSIGYLNMTIRYNFDDIFDDQLSILKNQLQHEKDEWEKFDDDVIEELAMFCENNEEFSHSQEIMDEIVFEISEKADQLISNDKPISEAFENARTQIFKERKITDPSLIKLLTKRSSVNESMEKCMSTLTDAAKSLRVTLESQINEAI